MTNKEIEHMWKVASNDPHHDFNWFDPVVVKFAKLVAEKAVEESNHIIFKSCINLPHWKRTAMRYLKRNAPMLHYQAVHEFNEHPDGRGQE